MPPETEQKTFKFLGKLTLGPPAANSKRCKPALMTFVKIFQLLCLYIPSNIDTDDKVGAFLT